jgi:N-acetylmuramoyl-L-alanine amidase
MLRRAMMPGALALLAAAVILGAGPGRTALAAARFVRHAERLEVTTAAYLAAPPLALARGVSSPWRVGIQAGHWDVQDLPDEQARLRESTGTRWGSIREADVNLRIARGVVDRLRAAGVVVDLLPATVPAGYDADAFVAIHADDGGGRPVRGWKVAAPPRSSASSRLLRDSIARAYLAETGLPEDRYGVTFGMRGYYAFSWTRYEHAASASTPSAIIETGFLTSSDDRRVIVDDPGRAAAGIAFGILAYLAQRPALPPDDLVPRSYPVMAVATDEAAVRFFPTDDERVAARLPAGTIVRPVDEENGWAELMVVGNFRLSGWMRLSDLRALEGWT